MIHHRSSYEFWWDELVIKLALVTEEVKKKVLGTDAIHHSIPQTQKKKMKTTYIVVIRHQGFRENLRDRLQLEHSTLRRAGPIQLASRRGRP